MHRVVAVEGDDDGHQASTESMQQRFPVGAQVHGYHMYTERLVIPSLLPEFGVKESINPNRTE